MVQEEGEIMIVLDLYCGLGGWAVGFLEAGHRVIGYDIVDFSKEYPGWFVKADLLDYTNFPCADVIVASPPCTDFSKAAFPQTWRYDTFQENANCRNCGSVHDFRLF